MTKSLSALDLMRYHGFHFNAEVQYPLEGLGTMGTEEDYKEFTMQEENSALAETVSDEELNDMLDTALKEEGLVLPAHKPSMRRYNAWLKRQKRLGAKTNQFRKPKRNKQAERLKEKNARKARRLNRK